MNNPNVLLRLAGAGDAERLHGIYDLKHVPSYLSPRTLADIEASFSDPDDEYIIGETESDPFIGFVYLRGLENPHRSIELRQLAVAIPGRGYGRAFLSQVVADVFVRHQPQRLWLDVFPDNTVARRLYEKLGFVEEGILRDAYLWNGEFRSAVIMSILGPEHDGRG